MEGNPLLDWAKWIIFPIAKHMIIPADPKWGTDERIYQDYQTLEDDFKAGKLHPGDFKKSMTSHINQLLDPVRKHFQENKEAKNLLKKVKSYRK